MNWYGMGDCFQRWICFFLSDLLCVILLVSCGTRLTSQESTRDGIYHQVQRGQTLWGIAKAYEVELKTLARINNISDTDTLYVGQKNYIPKATKRPVVSRCPCSLRNWMLLIDIHLLQIPEIPRLIPFIAARAKYS